MNNFWELTKKMPNEKNEEVVNDFLLSLKLANRSRGTIILYRRFLEHFFSNMEHPFSSLSSESIHQWYMNHQSHVKEATLQLRLSILSSFYIFCVREELMKQSPMKSRWFPRLPQAVPKYLNKEDLAKTRRKSEMTTLRNQLLIEFMLATGCRIAEVVHLNREDIDVENRTARVVGKGKKIRHVHFTERCAVLLERYLATSQKHTPEALFVTSTGKRLGIRIIQQMVTDLGKDAGLTTQLYPHRLRHTFATELLSKGAELSFISEELGHRDIGTTQIYARLPKQEIISLYRKYMG